MLYFPIPFNGTDGEQTMGYETHLDCLVNEMICTGKLTQTNVIYYVICLEIVGLNLVTKCLISMVR